MDGRQTAHASGIEPLQCPNPQFQVGIHRIFHENRHVDAFQRVGKGLHGERIGRCPRTHPERVDAVFQCQFHVFGRRHLDGYSHSQFVFHPLEPGQCLLAVSLETTWLRARLPHAGTEDATAHFLQFSGRRHHLFFVLRRTRPRNHKGALLVVGQAEGF